LLLPRLLPLLPRVLLLLMLLMLFLVFLLLLLLLLMLLMLRPFVIRRMLFLLALLVAVLLAGLLLLAVLLPRFAFSETSSAQDVAARMGSFDFALIGVLYIWIEKKHVFVVNRQNADHSSCQKR
jgi:4-amino-4-deoxy-L-arabinose transferase-like glycosyltransferase